MDMKEKILKEIIEALHPAYMDGSKEHEDAESPKMEELEHKLGIEPEDEDEVSEMLPKHLMGKGLPMTKDKLSAMNDEEEVEPEGKELTVIKVGKIDKKKPFTKMLG